MPRSRLTELQLQKVKPPRSGRLELADAQAPGLSCRVTPDGCKTFALRYRVGGRQRRLTIGRWPGVGLVEARRRAHALREQVERGEDPAKAEDGPAPGTVGALVKGYIEKRLKPRTRRWADVEAMLARDVLRAWGSRPVASIARRDVRDLLEGITGRGAPVVANRVLSHLRGLFKWAIRNDYCEANPALDIDRPHEERPRERTLDELELRAVWRAFETMGFPFGRLGQLLILTGARRGEWAGAGWAEVDLGRRVWTVAAGLSKTGAALTRPLPGAACAILETVPRIDGSGLVFPSARGAGARSVSGFSRALLTAQKLSGVSGWHFHDLRRCVRSGLARLGWPPEVAERVLGHATDGSRAIVRIYNTYRYEDEVRAALEAWSGEVERIVAGKAAPKVVALRRVR